MDSIQNYIAGVKTLHNILDLKFPETTFHLKLGLKGIRKTLAHCPKRMEPMTPKILSKIYALLDLLCENKAWFGNLNSSNSVAYGQIYNM